MAKKPQNSKEVEAIVEKKGCEEIGVYTADGKFIRSYNAKLHGEDFIRLAEMFAGKVKGVTKKLR